MLRAAEAGARLARHIERTLADAELTLPQFRLLLHLETTTDTASDLARKAQIKPPSLTALVDGLANRNLVQRIPDDCDRRRVNLYITDEGRAALDNGRRAAAQRLQQLASEPDGYFDYELLEWLARWIGPLNRARDANAR